MKPFCPSLSRFRLAFHFLVLVATTAASFLLLASHAEAQRPERVMTGVQFDGDSTVISKIIKGGPADKAGLLVADEILSIGDDFVVQNVDVIIRLRGKKIGETTRVEVRRGEKFLIFDLVLINHVRGDKIIKKDGSAVEAPVKSAIENQLGPELKVTQWHNWTENEPPSIRKLEGKVVCLLLFQTSCEYSKLYGIPQAKELYAKYADDPDVTIMAIQTPFHEFETNTHANAGVLAAEQKIKFPVGHDGTEEQRSITFEAYKAPGTPWFIVLDKKNIVRYNDPDFPIEIATKLIEELKSEDPKAAAKKTDTLAEESAAGSSPTKGK